MALELIFVTVLKMSTVYDHKQTTNVRFSRLFKMSLKSGSCLKYLQRFTGRVFLPTRNLSPPKAESSLTDSSQISSNSFIFAQTLRVVVLFHASSTMTFFIVVVVVVVAAADVAGGSWLVFFAENYFLLPKSSPSDNKLNEI